MCLTMASGTKDITKILSEEHKECPCSYSDRDFIALNPGSDSPNPRLYNLLLDKLSKDNPNYEKIATLHFNILVQKYDPDSQTRSVSMTSMSKLKIINKAYCDTVRSLSQSSKLPWHENTAIGGDGKIYHQISEVNVYVQHSESFAVYCHPDYVAAWNQVLDKSEDFSEHVSNVAQSGVIHGNKESSCFITVYDSGTVHVQGVRGLYYGLNVMLPKTYQEVMKLHNKDVDTTTKRCSTHKKALKLFQCTKQNHTAGLDASQKDTKNGKKRTDGSGESPCEISPVNDHRITKNMLSKAIKASENKTENGEIGWDTEDDSDLWGVGDGSNKDSYSKVSIKELESETKDVGNDKEELLSKALKDMEVMRGVITELFRQNKELKERMTNLERRMVNESERSKDMNAIDGKYSRLEASVRDVVKENRQLKAEVGPRLGRLEKKIDEMSTEDRQEEPRDRRHMVVDKEASFAGVVAANTNPTQDSQHRGGRRQEQAATKHGRSQFCEKRIVVIQNIKNMEDFPTDDKVKAAVSQTCGRVIIEWVSRYGGDNPKIMCQLASEQMVSLVKEKWNQSQFKGSDVREPQKTRRQVGFYGIIKGVPVDIDSTVIQDSIQKDHPDTSAWRLMREGNPIRAVKISFPSKESLEKAVKDGVYLKDAYLGFQVEAIDSTPKIIICYNCHRIGHVKHKCRSERLCSRCSQKRHEGECTSPLKCINCKLGHSSTDTARCPVYAERLEQLHDSYNG